MSSLCCTRAIAARRMTLRQLSSSSGGPRKRSRSLPEAVPSLQEFIHKQKVLQQYRSFLKCIKLIEDANERDNAYVEVKRDFKKHRALKEPLAIQMAVTDGERKLKQVQSMVGYSDASTIEDEDSWLNTKDPFDERGRVGTGWPWQQK